MSDTLICIHGHYGSPDEAEHYKPLFPGQLDYSQAPVNLYVIGYAGNFYQNYIRDMV